MKPLAILALMTALATSTIAADKLELKTDDTAASLLARCQGQKVEIRLKSGDKITGKIVVVTGEMVHVTEIAGQEFFDAFVVVDDVSTVVVRAK